MNARAARVSHCAASSPAGRAQVPAELYAAVLCAPAHPGLGGILDSVSVLYNISDAVKATLIE
jgi:hypothetical protein